MVNWNYETNPLHFLKILLWLFDNIVHSVLQFYNLLNLLSHLYKITASNSEQHIVLQKENIRK